MYGVYLAVEERVIHANIDSVDVARVCKEGVGGLDSVSEATYPALGHEREPDDSLKELHRDDPQLVEQRGHLGGRISNSLGVGLKMRIERGKVAAHPELVPLAAA